ncbi:MAG: hypothetical protein PUB18_00940 [bacterium]|nr:hypothetical protein [bacterium]
MSFLSTIGEALNEISGVTAQNEYQKELANTAHQREVNDLKKAGLNPALSAMNGTSAENVSSNGAGNGIGNVANIMNAGANLVTAAKKGKDNNQLIANTAKIIGMLAKWY